MKKMISGILPLILSSVLAGAAQIQKTTVRINRDRSAIAERLPESIRTDIDQIPPPQSDLQNRLEAIAGQALSLSFTLSPDATKINNRGQIDFQNVISMLTTGSVNNPYPVPAVFLTGRGSSFGSGFVLLTVRNNRIGGKYLVDLKTAPNTLVTVNGSNLAANSNGHVYFTLSSVLPKDIFASVAGVSVSSPPFGRFVFFSCEVSKVN